MKTKATPSSFRYRNDVVFRSAERLLASTPRKPARTWPPRGIVFVAGLLGGLAIAWWTLRPTTSNTPDSNSPTGTSHSASPRSPLPSSVPRGGQAPALVTTAQPSVPTGQPSGSTALNGERPTGPFDPDPSVMGNVRSLGPLHSPSTAGVAPTTAAPAIVVTQTIATVTLRGHLLYASGEKVGAVEFALNLSPVGSNAPVAGLVRFIDDPELRDERHVSGTWRGGTLTLKQADAPNTRGLRPYGQRTFTLEFTGSGVPVTGRWTHQTPLGASDGTLSLVIALPE